MRQHQLYFSQPTELYNNGPHVQQQMVIKKGEGGGDDDPTNQAGKCYV